LKEASPAIPKTTSVLVTVAVVMMMVVTMVMMPMVVMVVAAAGACRPAARLDSTARLHPDRRGNAPDRSDWRVGHATSLRRSHHIGIAINLSPTQFKMRNLVQMVMGALARLLPGHHRAWAHVHRSPWRKSRTSMIC
jgi:hypothetical protein